MRQRFGSVVVVAILAMAAVVSVDTPVYAGGQNGQSVTFQDAVGSWFGRATPVNPPCTPGTEGCPVPRDIIMMFTVNAEGTFMAIDSNMFTALHSPAHGQWVRSGPRSIKAEFTLMQSEGGVFIGSFKNVFDGTVVTPDEMHGTVQARLYAYVDPATGEVIVDENGFPTPSPVAPPSACSDTPRCVYLGEFEFVVRRVKVH